MCFLTLYICAIKQTSVVIMPRKQAKTTVIFVNKNQNAGKPIQIPSFYIEHWKKYVLSLIVLSVVLISVIVYLNYSKTILESSRNKIALDLLKRKKAIRS